MEPQLDIEIVVYGPIEVISTIHTDRGGLVAEAALKISSDAFDDNDCDVTSGTDHMSIALIQVTFATLSQYLEWLAQF